MSIFHFIKVILFYWVCLRSSIVQIFLPICFFLFKDYFLGKFLHSRQKFYFLKFIVNYFCQFSANQRWRNRWQHNNSTHNSQFGHTFVTRQWQQQQHNEHFAATAQPSDTTAKESDEHIRGRTRLAKYVCCWLLTIVFRKKHILCFIILTITMVYTRLVSFLDIQKVRIC